MITAPLFTCIAWTAAGVVWFRAGVAGLLTRRPVLFSFPWALLSGKLVILGVLAMMLHRCFTPTWLISLVALGVVGFGLGAWLYRGAWVVVGLSLADLRARLRHALDKLGVAHHEQACSIVLPNEAAHIRTEMTCDGLCGVMVAPNRGTLAADLRRTLSDGLAEDRVPALTPVFRRIVLFSLVMQVLAIVVFVLMTLLEVLP